MSFISFGQGILVRVLALEPYALLLSAFSGSALAVPENMPARAADQQVVQDLRTYLDQQAAADRFSGAVLLAKGDKVLFEGAYGFANHAFNVSNKVDTKFNIGSMGKMFTAVSIMQLIERGKLSLQDKLIKAVPDYPDQDIAQKVTIYQLLTHTSGLGNFFNERFENTPRYKLDSIQGYMALFAGKPLLFEPGTSWSYSNAGYVVLGLVIEKVSGQSYYDYVREHIFKPAGMINTDNYAPHDDVPNLALGYTTMDQSGGPPKPRPMGPAMQLPKRAINSDFMHRGASAGNGYSTVEDLFCFAQALQQHKLLNKENTETLMSGKVATDRPGSKYGFGMMEASVNGVRIVGHSGGAPGINGKLDMYPELGYTVAVLANYDMAARGPIELLQRELTGQQ